MEYLDDSDTDISWLTQTPRIEASDNPNFDIGYRYVEEDILSNEDNVVSLEDSDVNLKGKILYDNVLVEDISSDESIDLM